MPTRPDIVDLSDVSFPVLDFDRPTSQQIFDALKVAILRTTLPPGCLISENEIGLRFGASRTPVREAFTQLRNDGLIVTRPSRGNFVTKLSEARIREAQFLREALELANVAQLCRKGIPDAALADLQSALTAQAHAIQANDDLAFQDQDDQFHATLARATGFARAETLLVREKMALDRLRVLSLSDGAHKQRLLNEHHAILKTVVAGGQGAAKKMMRQHLRSIFDALSNLIAANRDYFDDASTGQSRL
jgi:DNA-binding GntR family transcriptional regulator